MLGQQFMEKAGENSFGKVKQKKKEIRKINCAQNKIYGETSAKPKITFEANKA